MKILCKEKIFERFLKYFNEKNITILFIVFCFFNISILATIQPINCGPDEKMKMDICKYIAEYGRLPHGGDKQVLDSSWGISYGFTPILSYMIAGVFIKITSFFTQDLHSYYVAARMVSVICYLIFIFFVIKIGKKLFSNKMYKWLFIIFNTILPQVGFIGSYINNDSLALMCIAIIIYSWINGMENNWKIKNCIHLAIGLGLCALSYYNAYGYILTSVILFVISEIINKVKFKEIIKKGMLIFAISFLLCGWWFIRSAIIYNGDFLGLKTTNEYSDKYAIDEFKASKRLTPQKEGISLLTMLIERRWLAETVKSFIGVFGNMDIYISTYIYIIMILIWSIGILGYILYFYKSKKLKKDKNKFILEIFFCVNIIISLGLSLYYSYSSDFQPQGRYIMPMLVPFIYIVTCGYKFIFNKFIKKIKIRYALFSLLISILILVFSISIGSLISIYVCV